MDMNVTLPEFYASEILQRCNVSYAIVTSPCSVQHCSNALLNIFQNSENLEANLEAVLEGKSLSDVSQISLVGSYINHAFNCHLLESDVYLLVSCDPGVEKLNQELSFVNNSLSELADCNLDQHFDVSQQKGYASESFLQTTIANLNEVVRQIQKSCSKIDSTSMDLNTQSQELANRSTQQFEATDTTSSAMDELNVTTANNAERTSSAEQLSIQTVDLAKKGKSSVEELINAIIDIDDAARQMDKIIETVDLITFQTNILSINAAVEAAHAGEHGRGFSIVAQEVRALAKRSATSSAEIKELIGSTIGACKNAKNIAEQSGEVVTQMNEKVSSVFEDLSSISSASQEQAVGIDQVTKAINKVADLAEQNNTESVLLSEHTAQLRQEVEHMQDVISVFKTNQNSFSHPLHEEMAKLVQQAALDIQYRFEEAVNNHQISFTQLFDRNYIEVAGTNPQRYETQFDQFTDDQIGPIQEMWLQQHASLVYIILSDENGYVPTHNLAFSKPLTGDYQTDLAGNRTKRIFTDRVGQSVGKHTEPFLIQTYRRDTGELMFDLSVPLYIHGQHWGGVRAGYRLTV